MLCTRYAGVFRSGHRPGGGANLLPYVTCAGTSWRRNEDGSDSMDFDLIARCLHVLGVVFWIGGVALVTTAVLPAAVARQPVAAQLELFEAIERRFAPQARIATLIVGATGFFLVARLDLWFRFSDPTYWWMHAMLGLWLVFMLMLFVLDPFVFHRFVPRLAATHPRLTFAALVALHWVLLLASLITIAGAVAGSHGGNLW